MKSLFLTLILSLFLLVPSQIFAEDEELTEAGLTPESPFYFLDQVGEYIEVLFTFDDDAKLEKELLFAEERLAELSEVSETADDATIEKLNSAYNKKVSNAIFLANKGENKENRLQVIEQARERHVVKLQAVVNKAPAQALPALDKVMEKAQVKLDDIQSQIEQESQRGASNGDTDKSSLRDRVDDAVKNTKATDKQDSASGNSGSSGSNGAGR